MNTSWTNASSPSPYKSHFPLLAFCSVDYWLYALQLRPADSSLEFIWKVDMVLGVLIISV